MYGSFSRSAAFHWAEQPTSDVSEAMMEAKASRIPFLHKPPEVNCSAPTCAPSSAVKAVVCYCRHCWGCCRRSSLAPRKLIDAKFNIFDHSSTGAATISSRAAVNSGGIMLRALGWRQQRRLALIQSSSFSRRRWQEAVGVSANRDGKSQQREKRGKE